MYIFYFLISGILNRVLFILLQPCQAKERSVLDVLRDSLNDHSSQSLESFHLSIQSDIRYQLIIDTSGDESLSRLLFSFELLDKSTTKVFICSSFPGDVHGAVSIDICS